MGFELLFVNILRTSLGDELDYIVLFSTISSLISSLTIIKS